MPAKPIELSFTDAPAFSDPEAILTVIPCVTDPDSEKAAALWTPALKALADKLKAGGGRELKDLMKDEAFKAEHGQVLYLPDSPAGRVLLAGLGSRGIAVHRCETVLAAALGRVRLKKLPLVAAVLPDLACSVSSTALAVVGAFHQYCYRSRESRKAGPELKQLRLHAAAKAKNEGDEKQILSEISAMCEGRALTMDLVNTPSNIKRTSTLVQQAQSIGEAGGLTVEIVDDVDWIEKNMPCFFSVARGSVESDPPKWIHLCYRPGDQAKRKIALVGKAVIFDTGGYQVKPGEFMNTMKADMAGSAAVFGAMHAIAALRPAGLEVHAYFAATPNMIDSEAMLPDSVVDTTCGKKVEIRHTDAEGRLTLIDAVAMAEREAPEAIVTVATLTGAASRAVGMGMALMSRPEH
ncbi:MAG: M17 family peptidase N-terminal domain-containing protein, partial [Leptospirales bacterium]